MGRCGENLGGYGIVASAGKAVVSIQSGSFQPAWSRLPIQKSCGLAAIELLLCYWMILSCHHHVIEIAQYLYTSNSKTSKKLGLEHKVKSKFIRQFSCSTYVMFFSRCLSHQHCIEWLIHEMSPCSFVVSASPITSASPSILEDTRYRGPDVSQSHTMLRFLNDLNSRWILSRVWLRTQ